MFEHDWSRQLLAANARTAYKMAEDNRDIAGQWEKAYHEQARLLAAQKARITELEDTLAVRTAEAAGLRAQSIAYRDQHPDSPLRVDSGKRFKDGSIKRRIILVYEAAFDARARELGIANPASRRVD